MPPQEPTCRRIPSSDLLADPAFPVPIDQIGDGSIARFALIHQNAVLLFEQGFGTQRAKRNFVASANSPPAKKSHPPARHAPHTASSPATSRLSCCSLIPCTMGNQPSISTMKINAIPSDALQRRTGSHRKTVASANPTNNHRNPFCTTSNGRSTVGASRNTTYAG